VKERTDGRQINVKASVVIPAYNADQTLINCLNALREQDIAIPYEIIVVDDCSDDQTASLVTGSDVTLIKHDKRRGAAAARNNGIKAARGEIICFTDADCAPKSDWLYEILIPFSDRSISGCKGVYITRQNEVVARFVQIEYEDKYNLLEKQAHIDFIDTYSAAYRREVLQTNNGFDEQFTYLEDQELSFRLAARGYKMVFHPQAAVYHQHADSLAAYARKKFTIGYWKAQVVRRFPNRLIQDSHTPQVMKVQMLLAALAMAAALAVLITPWSGVILGAVLLLFFMSAVPFIRKAWAKDKLVALASPFLLFVRAGALGFGYAWGLAKPAQILEQGNLINNR
jgi:cellulose synthase/poly-beta-1,6-N-acetylglucosamine synthase-like glycosyltransferase